ncbi:MAG: helix-turn-helix domain-containing protein [Armatimonas sp.]
MAEFHSFLKSLRCKKGLSLGQLAAYSGVSKATLSRWESGVHLPRIPELFRVLEALEASAAQISEALLLINQPRAIHITKAATDRPGTISLGDLLFALRNRAGLSQEEVARRCGIYRTQYRQWENDDCRPHTDQLHTLAFMMGASKNEIQAVCSMNFGSAPMQKERDTLLAVLHSVYTWDIHMTRATRELQLLAVYAGMLQLYRNERASSGDLALLFCEFGTVESIWPEGGELRKEQYFARASKLAEQSLEPLSLHVIPALSEENSEDLLAWSPAFATVEGKAYLLSCAASQMARVSPDRAVQLGERSCQLVENNPDESPCRRRDYGNLLVRCGRVAQAVRFIANLETPDIQRETMRYIDLAEAYLALGSQKEARACVEKTLALFPTTSYGFFNRARASVVARLN